LTYPEEALSVVVIDHDPDASARPVVDRASPLFRDLRYGVEPVRLISAARNRLAAEALRTDAELVVFVDDDEYVPEGWLTELVATADRLSADALAGPVIPVYEEGVPSWVVDGGFFERARFRTGERVRGHGIGNVLVRREWLERLSPPFGNRFRMPGGEDVHFLMMLERSGAKTYWCDEGYLFEWVPIERGTRRWIVRRAYHMSSAFSECLRSTNASTSVLTVRAAKCSVRVVQGLGECLLAPLRGPVALTSALSRIAIGRGGLRGLFASPVATDEASQ
jgi:hypothetical protein